VVHRRRRAEIIAERFEGVFDRLARKQDAVVVPGYGENWGVVVPVRIVELVVVVALLPVVIDDVAEMEEERRPPGRVRRTGEIGAHRVRDRELVGRLLDPSGVADRVKHDSPRLLNLREDIRAEHVRDRQHGRRPPRRRHRLRRRRRLDVDIGEHVFRIEDIVVVRRRMGIAERETERRCRSDRLGIARRRAATDRPAGAALRRRAGRGTGGRPRSSPGLARRP
jgi:hypothetical protein